MTTFVAGKRVRPFRLDLFADITTAEARPVPGGFEFNGDLGVAEQRAIYDRMTSLDDDDQAARAKLRAAATAGASNLAEMHLAYTLGDPIPDAVLPQT